MILLDFVGERGLRLPRERYSNRRLWKGMRAAARRAGVASVFPGARGRRCSTITFPSSVRGSPRST